MESKWPLPHKAIFLFLSTYLFLYMFIGVFQIHKLLHPVWEIIIPRFAQFWGYENTINTSLSNGDFVNEFFKICLYSIVAFFTAIIVLLIDFNRNNYNKQLQWLTVCIRYYVCYMMLAFGIMKFSSYGQFPPLTDTDLSTKLGDMSPGGLLFNFMSYSRPYVILAGALEVAGGLLLLNRRTVTIGALLLFGVVLNVLMVNLSYNFMQKILSIHLLAMILYLILLEGKGLYQFFILRKPAQLNTNNLIFPPTNIKAKNILKFLVIVFMFGYFSYTKYDLFFIEKSISSYNNRSKITCFFGVHNIEQNSRNIDGYPLSELPDSLNWKAFYQSKDDNVLVKTQNDQFIYYAFEPDIKKQIFRIKRPYEEKFYELPYEQVDTNRLRINGSLAGYYVDFTMHRTNDLEFMRKRSKKYRLTSDEFSWIMDWDH